MVIRESEALAAKELGESIKKLKVVSADIIVSGTKDKPYFEIKYMEVGKNDYNIGYGSYCLDYVFEWKNECFVIVEKKSVLKRYYEKIKNAIMKKGVMGKNHEQTQKEKI